MNVLHVLSQFEVTGAETFTALLANEQFLEKDNVYIISDTFSSKVDAQYIPFSIGKRNYPQRIRNVNKIIELIKKYNIQIVHAHSRASSWVTFYATKITDTPFVSSIHGRQHVHLSSKYFHIYGEKLLPVCESIKEHLIKDLRIPPSKISLIRNGIFLNKINETGNIDSIISQYSIAKNEIVISLIGRLTGPKRDIAKFIISEVFPSVVESIDTVKLFVIGGNIIDVEINNLIDSVNNKIGQKIIFVGFQSNIKNYILQSNIIIGSGRVALESLSYSKTVVAIGESNYVGVVSKEHEKEILSSNFGDAGIKKFLNSRIIADEIINAIKNSEDQKINHLFGLELLEREYNIKKISKKIKKIYEEMIISKSCIKQMPILMYHQIVNSSIGNSKHGIWVTKSDFEYQVQFLLERGFTTITFKDIIDFINGVKKPPKKPIMLTFDDGYRDNYYNAFPILKKYELKAVIFLVANPEIRNNIWDSDKGEKSQELLSKDQIIEMHSSGIEFGSHTLNHAKLTELPDHDLLNELKVSKEIIEDLIQSEVNSVCYPYGAVNEVIKKAVEECGYRFGVASDSGPNQFGEDFFEIKRIQIFPNTSKFGFLKKTSISYLKYKEIKKRFAFKTVAAT